MEKYNTQLTILDAYIISFKFLEYKYEENSLYDSLGVLLGGMSFLSLEQTADPATWSEWLQCVSEVVADCSQIKRLSPKESYLCMQKFLELFNSRYKDKQLNPLIEEISGINFDNLSENRLWSLWVQIIKEPRELSSIFLDLG